VFLALVLSHHVQVGVEELDQEKLRGLLWLKREPGFFAAAALNDKCGALRDFRTGTGFASAKLSEILPAARVARFVRKTNKHAPLFEILPLRSRCSLRQDDKSAGQEVGKSSLSLGHKIGRTVFMLNGEIIHQAREL
jgi:hypothetical protein